MNTRSVVGRWLYLIEDNMLLGVCVVCVSSVCQCLPLPAHLLLPPYRVNRLSHYFASAALSAG